MNKAKGFTLLELLVVIAIIGLISTIVMASISLARTKARNSYITSTMLQYVNAFSMYFNSNGSYPSPSDNTNPIKCLGHRTSQCGMVTYNSGVIDGGSPFGEQSAQLDAELETSYSAAPPFENVLVSSSGTTEIFFQGPTYGCSLYVSGRCMSVDLTWYLIGNDQKCVRGSTPSNDGAATACVLTMN